MREETSCIDYARRKILASSSKKFPSKVLAAMLRDGGEIISALDSVTFSPGIKENLLRHKALEAFLGAYYAQALGKRPSRLPEKVTSVASSIIFSSTSQGTTYWGNIWDTER